MAGVTTQALKAFFQRLGEQISDSIALSKIARGFEADLEDVEFLLRKSLIDWESLEMHFQSVLPRARQADIDPKEFQQYFETLRKRLGR